MGRGTEAAQPAGREGSAIFIGFYEYEASSKMRSRQAGGSQRAGRRCRPPSPAGAMPKASDRSVATREAARVLAEPDERVLSLISAPRKKKRGMDAANIIAEQEIWWGVRGAVREKTGSSVPPRPPAINRAGYLCSYENGKSNEPHPLECSHGTGDR